MDIRRIIPVTPDVVSLWIPSGTNRAIDIIRGNDGQCYGTHPNVPVISGKNLVINGGFTTDDDPPDDWIASNTTLSTESGGLVGNCMKVLDGGAGNGYGYQSILTVVGKVYNFTCWAKDSDTGQNGLIEVGTSAGNAVYYSSGTITDDTGVTYTATFTATTTTTFISLNCTSSGGTYYFDSVSLKEHHQLINPSVGWHFDGTNDYVKLPNNVGHYTDKFVIGSWFKTTGINMRPFFSRRNVSVTEYDIYIADNGTLAIYTGALFNSGKVVNDDIWHRGVIVINGASSQFFVDGVAEGSTFNPSISGDAGEAILGAMYDGTNGNFDGHIAFPFLVKGIWSQAQVTNDWLLTRGLFAPRG